MVTSILWYLELKYGNPASTLVLPEVPCSSILFVVPLATVHTIVPTSGFFYVGHIDKPGSNFGAWAHLTGTEMSLMLYQLKIRLGPP